MIDEVTFTNAPMLEQLVLNTNNLDHIDIRPVQNTLNALSLVNNRFTFATLPLQADFPRLNVYYYGNQAPMDVQCIDGKVDLSSQAVIDDIATSYTWYAGVPEYDAETGQITGNLLTEGTDYEIEGGVTTFLKQPEDQVICMMANDSFPNLSLYVAGGRKILVK